jgi:hypothetical protein
VANQNPPQSTLLIRPYPYRNEGPKGYLLRLAEANWMPLKQLQSIGLMYEYQTLQMEALMPPKEVDPELHQSVEYYSALLYRKERVWNHKIPRHCPQCLGEDAFWRAEWELFFHDACSIHGTWLIDQCSSCGNQLSWDRDSIVRCHCGADLRVEVANSCPDSVIKLSQILRIKINRINRDQQITAPFTKTDIEQTQRIIRYLGTYMSESADKNPLKVKQVAHMSRSWTITSLAAEILTSWPDAFYRSLTNIQSKSAAEDKPTFNKVFGHAYHYLYRGLTGSAFVEMREAFEIWLSQSWRGGLAKRNKRLTAFVVDHATWIPGNLACDILGISGQRLKYLIREGAIEGECYITEKEREFIMVHRETLEVVKQNLSGEIDMTTARTLLGLGKKRTQQLLRLIFPEARKSGTSSSSPWTVSRFEVNKLLEVSVNIPKVCIPDEDCVSLAHILRYWAWTAKDIANLVNAIRTQELLPINVLEGVAGITAWVFPEKVLKAWREASLQGLGMWLTITQAAKLLGMHEQSAYDAVKLNLLNSELLHRQPRGGKRIRRTEVDRFKSTYILASELAQRLGVSPRMAIGILAKQAITPVSGPLIDNGRQVIFLRTPAIEQLILEAENQESLPMELKSHP